MEPVPEQYNHNAHLQLAVEQTYSGLALISEQSSEEALYITHYHSHTMDENWQYINHHGCGLTLLKTTPRPVATTISWGSEFSY